MKKMDLAQLSITFGIIILIIAITINVLPYNSSGVSYALFWVGSSIFIGTGVFTIITGRLRKENFIPITFSLGLVSFGLLLFSGISGIIHNINLFYIDEIEELLQLLSYFDVDFMAFSFLTNPLGIKTYHMYFTFSIVDIVLSALGFVLVTIIFYLFKTEKLTMEKRSDYIKDAYTVRIPTIVRTTPKKIAPKYCPRCDAPLSKKLIETLMDNKVTECEYCGSALTHDDF